MLVFIRLLLSVLAVVSVSGCLVISNKSYGDTNSKKMRVTKLSQISGRYSNVPWANGRPTNGVPLSWYLVPDSQSSKVDEIRLVPTSQTNLTIILLNKGEQAGRRDLVLGQDFSIENSEVPLAIKHFKSDTEAWFSTEKRATRSSGKLFLSKEGDIILAFSNYSVRSGKALAVPYAGVEHSKSASRYRRIE